MARVLSAFLFALALSACSGGTSGGNATAASALGAASLTEAGGTTAAGTVAGQSAGTAENAAAAPAAMNAIAMVDHSTQAAASAATSISTPGGITLDLSAVANVEAIAKDGTAVGNGGIDGHGEAYSATL